MSNELQGLVYRCKLGSPITKAIAIKLADHGDDEGGSIYPGKESLSTKTEVSKRAVDEHINMLLCIGLLRLEDCGGGARNTALYSFDMDMLRGLSDGDIAIEQIKADAIEAGLLDEKGKPEKATVEMIKKGAADASFTLKMKGCSSRRVRKRKGAPHAKKGAPHAQNPAPHAPEPNNPNKSNSAGARDDPDGVSASPVSGEKLNIEPDDPLYAAACKHPSFAGRSFMRNRMNQRKGIWADGVTRRDLEAFAKRIEKPIAKQAGLTDRSRAMTGEIVE